VTNSNLGPLSHRLATIYIRERQQTDGRQPYAKDAVAVAHQSVPRI